MKKNESTRREFIKRSSIGLGVLSVPILSAKDPVAERKLSVFCIGAHPGDPEFGCGGTLLKYSSAGHVVTVLYLTRGEAGDPAKSFAESAALRTREAEASCEVLKARAVFAGQTDGNTELNQKTCEAMSKLILSGKPDIVFTHWPLDTHRDHQIAGLLTLNAWVTSGKQFDLYFYEVNTGDETLKFQPTDYVDITDVRERKKTALLIHQTQRPQQVYDSYFKPMEDFRGLEAGVKAAEGFIHLKARSDRARLVGL